MKYIINIFRNIVLLTLLGACEILPDIVAEQEVRESIVADRLLLEASQSKVSGTLSLEEAMARALKYNLEHRTEVMRSAFASQNFEAVKMDMLPLLTAQAGYSNRSNYDASRGFNVSTFTENDDFSTSSEKEHFTADSRFVWNILDFGVSYLQAKQEGMRYLSGDLARKQAVLRLVDNVRTQYWRAAAFKKFEAKLNDLRSNTFRTLVNLKRVRQAKLRPPRQVLEDIRSLTEISQQLEEMYRTITLAMIELRTLIGASSRSQFQLAAPSDVPSFPNVLADFEKLELLALTNSGEYLTEIYNSKIDHLESRKALLRLLPGLEFSYGVNYDTNRFLYNKTWGEVGSKVSYDIFKLLSIKNVKNQNEAREALALNKKLMSNIATVTKVHLSWQNYQNAKAKFNDSDLLVKIDNEISSITSKAQKNRKISAVEKVKTDARALRSLMGQTQNYIDAQAAFGSLLLSLGINPAPKNYQEMALDQLTSHFSQFNQNLYEGKIEGLNWGSSQSAQSNSRDSRLKALSGLRAKQTDSINSEFEEPSSTSYSFVEIVDLIVSQIDHQTPLPNHDE